MDAFPNRYSLLNTYVNALTMEETVACVEEIIASRTPTQHVVINASKVNLMRDDPKLAEIVNACPLINADGSSIVWAAKKLGVPLAERVTGCDLFQELVAVAADRGYGVYLFGAREEVVTEVRSVLERRHPGIRIVGCRNGYFSEEDEPGIVADMAASGADMMFVAFSSPKKEYWIHKYLDQLGIPFVMGVGGSFDIVAGRTARAPGWMQRAGLEWLYRFAQEPRRMWRRYVIGNARFVRYAYSLKREKKGSLQNG
ncbi:WecB/TagA/CpsF family glycosyltransferase [Adlercreutzia sp. ZJ473]|uniref:WecB/TagA/CpsF family glycosyltransferase n=1 Tax=Adlercreutzia sp. ZJ473 TaxID=2722822 RepID=UPI001551675B|nr:WecB/TagA/CpsF family glycosyltransferase [Adlercreutzia sp. ZJ473]